MRACGSVFVGTIIGCKFGDFLFDFPVPLEFGLSQAQKNDVLKLRMGGDISCPLYRRVFWDGAVSPDGRVQFKLPVQGPNCSATIHGILHFLHSNFRFTSPCNQELLKFTTI